VKLKIKYNEKILSENILLADTLWSRLIGLMFKKELLEADGLMLDPCRSIHTFFMRYSLDIVFINSKNEIIKIIRDLKPWRMTWIYLNACKTLELPAGKLPQDVSIGDRLEVINA
jgi:uncharacterized membrane protein (UPF0127 family)